VAGIIGISYPLMDLFVLALLIRLLLEGGLRNPAMRLIAAAQFTFLVADLGFALVPPGSGQNPLVFQAVTAVALAVFGLFGTAALHPSFTSITVDRAVARSERPWLRTALLCLAVLTGPAVLLIQAWQNDSQVPDAVAIAIGCAVIFGLVVFRLQTLVGRVAAQSVTLAQQADRLRVLASQDGLTGLANRRAWDGLLPDGLQRARRDGRPITIAMIDLDHFKKYNDGYGHQAGDRLLKGAAAAWALQLREVDMLARYGGEEFIALLPGCPADEGTRVLDRLREVTPEGQTFSAGIAEWDGQETCEELVARADSALYEAKNAGRDRFVVAEAMTNSVAWTALPTNA
jgi:diguanylate cyclase